VACGAGDQDGALESVKERIVQFGDGHSLVGVLAEASSDAAQPTFILLNAGTLHRIGPHRVYVKIARALAAAGFPVLRFDLSGLGDSLPRRDNLPYTASSVRETQDAMDFLHTETPARHFVLMGSCSGADVAFRTACQDPRVVGAALIDWFAYRTAAWYLHHYRSALSALWAWTSRDGNGASEPLVRAAAPSGHRKRGRLMNDGDVPPKARSAADLRALIGRGVNLLFVYTGAQLAYYNYPTQLHDTFRSVPFRNRVEVDFQGEADHTLTLLLHQQRLVDRISRWATTVTWGEQPNRRELPASSSR
jgi:pimeloyl-ACP methyl ester carboxylesterase